VLARKPQHGTTRDQHRKLWTRHEQIGQEGSGIQEVLSVIHHEQGTPLLKMRRNTGQYGARSGQRRPKRMGDR
jgi:hypothetical protein